MRVACALHAADVFFQLIPGILESFDDSGVGKKRWEVSVDGGTVNGVRKLSERSVVALGHWVSCSHADDTIETNSPIELPSDWVSVSRSSIS